MRGATLASSSTLARLDGERPPRGMASRALTARFTITCSIWPGIGLHRHQRAAAERDDQLDVLADEPRGACVSMSPTTIVEVEHARLEDLLAAEDEQLPGEVGRPLGGQLDLARPVGDQRIVGRHRRAR